MKIKVTLLNKEELKNWPSLAQVGDFARVGTDSQSDAEKIGKHCIEAMHGSPQRVPRFIFQIEGVSRTMTHQLVRHNVGVSHNQRSQRYCIEDGFDYYTPDSLKGLMLPIEIAGQKLFLWYDQIIDICRQWYEGAIDEGIEPDDAREVLNNAVESKINTVMTLQALIHFCNDRLCSRASRQIREVARQMRREVEEVDPAAATYLVPKCHYNALGYCPEAKSEWKKCMRRPHRSIIIPENWKVTVSNQTMSKPPAEQLCWEFTELDEQKASND